MLKKKIPEKKNQGLKFLLKIPYPEVSLKQKWKLKERLVRGQLQEEHKDYQ